MVFKIKTNKVKKEHYLIRQDNTIYKFPIKKNLFKYRTRQIKTTKIRKLLILIESNSSLKIKKM